MFRAFVIGAALLAASGAQASVRAFDAVVTNIAQQSVVYTQGRFNVGDTSNYDLNVAVFKGKMVMTITQASAETITIEQKIDLQISKQDIVEVLDARTGAVKSITVNGKPQAPPDPKDTEIVSQTTGTITVPAGTFKCLDVKIHDKKQNADAEEWANPNDVPVGGMLKMVTKQQGMDIVAELTSFKRAP